MTSQPKNQAGHNLRQRAEQLLNDRARQLGTAWLREITDVFHELELRDLEIEIQNDDLLVAQKRLQVIHDRYANLYHFAPVGYFTLDEAGIIVDLNETGAVMLAANRTDFIGKLFSDNISWEDQGEFYLYLKGLLKTQALQSNEIRIMRADRSRFYGQFQGIVVPSQNNKQVRCRIAVTDVTRSRQQHMVDNLMRMGQHLTSMADVDMLLNQLVEAVLATLPSAEIAILWMHDGKNDTLFTRALAGYASKDLPQLAMSADAGLVGHIYRTGQARNIDDVRQEPLFVEFGYPHMEPVRSAMGVPIYNGDQIIGVLFAYNHSRVKNFSAEDLLLLEALATQISLILQNAGMFEQITAAHQQLRYLTQRVVTAQEEERRRVSRELHDEAGQALALLKLDLYTMQQEPPSDLQTLHQRLSKSVELVDQTAQQIRNLSYMLRPPVLDTMELNDVLQVHCADFAARTGIPVTYQGQPVAAPSDAVKITLYRFLQEALTNVVRHAHAHAVQVHLSIAGGLLTLFVQDDGDGFNLEQGVVEVKPQGIGLLGMRERLASVGGELEIISKIGDGMRLIARIPWEEKS